MYVVLRFSVCPLAIHLDFLANQSTFLTNLQKSPFQTVILTQLFSPVHVVLKVTGQEMFDKSLYLMMTIPCIPKYIVIDN